MWRQQTWMGSRAWRLGGHSTRWGGWCSKEGGCPSPSWQAWFSNVTSPTCKCCTSTAPSTCKEKASRTWRAPISSSAAPPSATLSGSLGPLSSLALTPNSCATWSLAPTKCLLLSLSLLHSCSYSHSFSHVYKHYTHTSPCWLVLLLPLLCTSLHLHLQFLFAVFTLAW